MYIHQIIIYIVSSKYYIYSHMQKATISAAGSEKQQQQQQQSSLLLSVNASSTIPKSILHNTKTPPLQKEHKKPSSPHSLKSNLHSYLYSKPRFGPSSSHLLKQKLKQQYNSSQSMYLSIITHLIQTLNDVSSRYIFYFIEI